MSLIALFNSLTDPPTVVVFQCAAVQFSDVLMSCLASYSTPEYQHHCPAFTGKVRFAYIGAMVSSSAV